MKPLPLDTVFLDDTSGPGGWRQTYYFSEHERGTAATIVHVMLSRTNAGENDPWFVHMINTDVEFRKAVRYVIIALLAFGSGQLEEARKRSTPATKARIDQMVQAFAVSLIADMQKSVDFKKGRCCKLKRPLLNALRPHTDWVGHGDVVIIGTNIVKKRRRFVVLLSRGRRTITIELDHAFLS